MNHKYYINQTFKLAQQGLGTTSPNPLVGAIIVKDGLVIASGHHERSGEGHAEYNAIMSAKKSIEGATLYCNLEPCCHTNKKTPPCVDLIIKSGIKEVVISNIDPNPLVAGKGVQKLRDAGIEVISGILDNEGQELNEVFFHFIKYKTPFVHIKVAQTLDGKICTDNGSSKWISDEAARKWVHQLRLKYDAIGIGRKTLDKDSPRLNIRMGVENKGKEPFKVIFANPNLLNLKNQLLMPPLANKTIIIAKKADIEQMTNKQKAHFKDHHIKIITIENESRFIEESLEKLGQEKITSILIEGGGHLLSSFINNHLYNKLSIITVPKVIGNGRPFFVNKDRVDMANAIEFTNVTYELMNDQIIMHSKREI